MKKCSRCGIERPESDFYADKREKDGLRHACKLCVRAFRNARYLENQGKEIAASRKWKEENKAKHLEANKNWQEENRVKVCAHSRKWQLANPDLCAAAKAKRRALGNCAWASQPKIHEVYELAQEFRDAGFDVHVDHIIPLKSKNVSGLHVENNLRVCLANANLKKGNRLMEIYQ